LRTLLEFAFRILIIEFAIRFSMTTDIYPNTNDASRGKDWKGSPGFFYWRVVTQNIMALCKPPAFCQLVAIVDPVGSNIRAVCYLF